MDEKIICPAVCLEVSQAFDRVYITLVSHTENEQTFATK